MNDIFSKCTRQNIFRSGIFPFCVALRYSFTWLVLRWVKVQKRIAYGIAGAIALVLIVSYPILTFKYSYKILNIT